MRRHWFIWAYAAFGLVILCETVRHLLWVPTPKIIQVGMTESQVLKELSDVGYRKVASGLMRNSPADPETWKPHYFARLWFVELPDHTCIGVGLRAEVGEQMADGFWEPAGEYRVDDFEVGPPGLGYGRDKRDWLVFPKTHPASIDLHQHARSSVRTSAIAGWAVVGALMLVRRWLRGRAVAHHSQPSTRAESSLTS